MKPLFPIAFVIALNASGAALASDDCHRTMSEWQPRDAVTAHVSTLGISTDRLRIDDGCYEVKGRDGAGNRVELKLDPATLELMGLEVRFRPGADVSGYLPGARGPSARKGVAPQSLNAPAAPATPVQPAAR